MKDRTDTLEQIDEIGRLEKNWDSYGANPLDKRICENARHIVSFLPDDLPSPSVVPADGVIQFEWQTVKNSITRDLEIEIGSSDLSFLCVENYRVDEADVGELPWPFDDETAEQLHRLFNWVLFREV